MMGKVKAVLWDVDGTLLDFLYSQRLAITGCLEEIGVAVTEEMVSRYSQINDSYWKKLELGEVTKEELHVRRFTDLFDEYGITGVDVDAFRAKYLGILANTYAYLDDSLFICQSLKGKVRQYVITNGVTEVQTNKLKLSGFYDLMDGIFISEQIGTPKPHAGFFDYCMQAIGDLDREELMIVGDSLTSDIKGGVLYGIPTCWYRPKDYREKDDSQREIYEQYKPTYEISHLKELQDILWQNQKDRN